eukprot:260047-Prorocentrum_minimum.AAC.1
MNSPVGKGVIEGMTSLLSPIWHCRSCGASLHSTHTSIRVALCYGYFEIRALLRCTFLLAFGFPPHQQHVLP